MLKGLIFVILLVRSVLVVFVLIRVWRICLVSVLVRLVLVPVLLVMVLVLVVIFPVSRLVVLVRGVLVHLLPVPMSRLTRTPTETVLEIVMSVMGRVLAGEIIFAVPGLLLHAVVPVQGLPITVRLVLILLASAGMRPVAAIPAEIHFMPLELTAEGSASPAMVREVV